MEEEGERRKRPRLANTPVTYGGSSGSGLTDANRIPTEPSAETSWCGAKREWCRGPMRKRATRRWWECTEFTGGGEELDPVKLLAGRKDEEEYMTKHKLSKRAQRKSAGARRSKPRRPHKNIGRWCRDREKPVGRERLQDEGWCQARATFCCDSSMGSKEVAAQDVDGYSQEKEA